jgi:4-amino-4-deoxy-L-arabinose transferase-like glycosyltransferase
MLIDRARRLSWGVLVALALAQAWLFRHEISPDGVAYLDLSDAIVDGRLGDLVNAYWSPAYPFAIGVVRLVLDPTPLGAPQWEFTLVHVVNVLAFLLALGAFEWLLRAVDDTGARWGQRPFQSVVGRVAAYALFGIGTIDMITLRGTVPDMLIAAASFAAFACLLRLHENPRDRWSALRLGLVLAGGALTKSFFFPLGVVILATLAWSLLRRGGGAQLLLAASVFVVMTLPWIVVVSRSVGRVSTGETGSLNYAWYVNSQQPPNAGAMPRLAAPRDSLPLDGLAVFPDARGTNAFWYDPARWSRDLRPRLDVSQQLARLWLSAQYYAYVGAPFLLILIAIAAASRASDLRPTIERSYVVLVPCVAAIGAYALVYTTSRHLAPYVVGAGVVLAAAYPRDATLSARRLVIAIVVTLVALELVAPLRGRILLSYGLGATVLAALVVQRRRAVIDPALLRRVFALGVVVTAAIPGVLRGVAALQRPIISAEHPEWTTAQRLVAGGLAPGSKIAILGNPENSGWARLAGYSIVAVVPADRVAAFKALSDAERARIIAAFQRAGAVDLVEVGVILLPD